MGKSCTFYSKSTNTGYSKTLKLPIIPCTYIYSIYINIYIYSIYICPYRDTATGWTTEEY
jgi:hypothetical protein